MEETIKKIKAKIKNKKVPRRGWEPTGTLPYFPISEDPEKGDSHFYAKLCEIFKQDSLSKETLKKIQDAFHRYHKNKHEYPRCHKNKHEDPGYHKNKHEDLNAPNESEIEAAFLDLLNGIEKGPDEFDRRFKILDAISRDRLAMVDLPNNLDIMYADQADPQRILNLIDQALDNIKKDRTRQRKPREPLNRLIIAMFFIYEESLGKQPTISFNPYNDSQPYYGLFYDLIDIALKKIDSEKHSNILNPTLGRQIAEVIGQLKKL